MSLGSAAGNKSLSHMQHVTRICSHGSESRRRLMAACSAFRDLRLHLYNGETDIQVSGASGFNEKMVKRSAPSVRSAG